MDKACSETAFVIIPSIYTTGEIENFVVVKDRDDPEKIFENKKKWPGGGREVEDFSLEAAGIREVKEETGLDIFPPTEKILEVHKPSVWDGENPARSMHRDVFFKSKPPMDISFFASGDENIIPNSLVMGTEIEEAAWQSHDAILESIRQRQFFPNHAAAFVWRAIRERFLKTRDVTLLAPIVRRKNLCSWHIDGTTLILCFYEQCSMCRRYIGVPIYQKISQIDMHKPEPDGEAQDELLAGAVKFILIQSDAFFDYVYLEPIKGMQATYRLPAVIIEEDKKVKAEEIWRMKTCAYEWNIERVCLLKKNNSYFFVARSNEDRIYGLERFCINKHPPLIFLEDDREWRELCESITAYKGKKIEIQHEWWVQKNPKTNS